MTPTTSTLISATGVSVLPLSGDLLPLPKQDRTTCGGDMMHCTLPLLSLCLIKTVCCFQSISPTKSPSKNPTEIPMENPTVTPTQNPTEIPR